MASKLILPALLLLAASACAPTDEVIPAAHAAASLPAPHPALSADAEPDGNVYEYY